MSMQRKEDGFLPVVMEGLTESLKKKAWNELCETEEAKRDGLKELKSLIEEKDVTTCTNDDFLIMFLRHKKFNIKKAFEQVKSYSYQRHALMSYYGFIYADKVMPVLRHNICGILPKRDHEGRAMLYFMPCKYAPDMCEPDDVMRALQVLIHFALKFPATQVAGFALFSDAKVESFQTVQLVFQYVKFALPSIHAFPGRFQSINIRNTNMIVRTSLAILRPLIPSKLLSRTTFYDSSDKALLKEFDASILPEEFGGTMGPLSKVSSRYFDEIEDYIPALQASNHFFKRKDTVPFPNNWKEI